MDEAGFWALIGQCRRDSDGNVPELARLLRQRLADLPAEDIALFGECWDRARNRAYTWRLWAGAVVLAGGGDDSFESFRMWLISYGQATFEGVVADPERLVDLLRDKGDAHTEEFIGLWPSVYEQVTGAAPRRMVLRPTHPIGDPIDLDDDVAVRAAVPGLVAALAIYETDRPAGRLSP